MSNIFSSIPFNSELRDIQILVTGESFSPGIYTLSGGSNALHALVMSGGGFLQQTKSACNMACGLSAGLTKPLIGPKVGGTPTHPNPKSFAPPKNKVTQNVNANTAANRDFN